jgi:broad specificity phosphatase PhoE
LATAIDIGNPVTDVVLVRHAMPETDRFRAADLWHLGAKGRAAARQLARALPAGPLVLTSHEPKAVQTAEEISAVRSGEVVVHAGVREARRPPGWDERYRERARRYVGGQHYIGWEPQEAVVRRFDAAVHAGLDARGDAPLVIVDHGLALTLWLQSVGAVADVESFWSGLAFPDAWTVRLRSAGPALLATRPARLPL